MDDTEAGCRFSAPPSLSVDLIGSSSARFLGRETHSVLVSKKCFVNTEWQTRHKITQSSMISNTPLESGTQWGRARADALQLTPFLFFFVFWTSELVDFCPPLPFARLPRSTPEVGVSVRFERHERGAYLNSLFCLEIVWQILAHRDGLGQEGVLENELHQLVWHSVECRQGVPRCPVFRRATLRRLRVFPGQALLAARRGTAVLEGNVHVRVDVGLLAVLEAGEHAPGQHGLL